MVVEGRHLSPELNSVLAGARTVHETINSALPEFPLLYSGLHRIQVFVASFHLNHDLHGSILHLISVGGPCDGAAFALLRPVVESYIKGMWLLYCATETDIQKLIADEGIRKSLTRMMDEVDKKHGQLHFSQIRSNLVRLHSFTHGGFEQLVRRFDAKGGWGASYTDEEKRSLLVQASWTATAFARMYCLNAEGPESASWKKIEDVYEANLRRAPGVS